MSCCHKQQQQRYHNEITKTCIFIGYISVMFEHVSHITKLCKNGLAMTQRVTITSTRYHTGYHTFSLSLTWIGHNAKCYHNFNMLRHALPSIFSKFSMVWVYLQRVTTRYHKINKRIYINIFLKK